MARKGAAALQRGEDDRGPDPRDAERRRKKLPEPQPEWIRTDEDPGRPDGGARRVRSTEVPPLGDDDAAQIRKAASAATARHRELLVAKTAEAADALEHNRHQEALHLIRRVVEEVPEVPLVQRIAGLAGYRSGRWREAVGHLEAYARLTGETDVLPPAMDCYRALKRRTKVAEVWADLRRQSPEPDVLAEARIVAAASAADSGDLAGAISLLTSAGAGKALRNPGERHLRQWYALGDLYERAGDVPRARELFARVDQAEPDAFGVRSRLEALGAARPRPPRRRAGTSTKAGPSRSDKPSRTAPQA